MPEPFTFRDHVRYADLDARGHLNNVAFLTFVEAARIAFLRSLDPEYDPTSPGRRDLILAHTAIDYRAQASFEEEILAEVTAEDVEDRRFGLRFRLRAGADGRMLAEARNVVVGFDYDAQEPADVPAALRDALRRAG